MWWSLYVLTTQRTIDGSMVGSMVGSLELVCAMDATRIERIDVSLFALLNLARWMVLLSRELVLLLVLLFEFVAVCVRKALFASGD